MRLMTIILGGLLFFASCSKDDEDKLEGKWQLRQVEENGVTTKVDTVFYNFQNSLFMYQILTPTSEMCHSYGYKTIVADKQLLLELIDAYEFLKYTDWTSSKETFTIERLTGNQLILDRENKRYIFRKF